MPSKSDARIARRPGGGIGTTADIMADGTDGADAAAGTMIRRMVSHHSWKSFRHANHP